MTTSKQIEENGTYPQTNAPSKDPRPETLRRIPEIHVHFHICPKPDGDPEPCYKFQVALAIHLEPEDDTGPDDE